jgi:hypothetical protein
MFAINLKVLQSTREWNQTTPYFWTSTEGLESVSSHDLLPASLAIVVHIPSVACSSRSKN